MKNNGIDNGFSNGLVNPYSFVGNVNGMQNSEQQISDVNTFIFTVKTTSNKTVLLPLVSTGTYNFWVDWGDGVKDYVRAFAQIYSGETAVRTHTYPTALKEYTVKITGVCKGWNYFNVSAAEQQKVTSIKRFGCLELINDATNGSYFLNCYNLNLSDADDVLNIKNIINMFHAFDTIGNNNLKFVSNWDVSNITNMSYMFGSSPLKFNRDLSQWNVSNVTNMFSMFQQCTLFNSDITQWKVDNVTNMGQMFFLCTSFNQDISIWNVSNVTIMSEMFRIANSFNQNINIWDVSKVTTMAGMFQQCTIFDQPLNLWNTALVTDMGSMFNAAPAFNQDIGMWNVSNVISTGFVNFMAGKTPATFSTANLDAIYNGWSSRPSALNASISFGNANYTTAGGSAGRAILVGRGWTIVDGGGI